ncbi:MAG: hypothetical protein ACE5I3_15770 [Phycisphaerae bacterium]
MSHASKSIGLAVGLVTVATALTTGCSGDFLANLIEERSGNITVIIINNTPYRAAFTLGSYDALDRDPPGNVNLEQRRLEGNMSMGPVTIPCNRNTAVGTTALIQRAIDNDADERADFDADAFVTVVNFSSAPADSDAAALPTVGTAEGVEVRLGVDYGCGDELIFTFVEDAAAPGGFRIEFRLLPAEEEES